jgi:flavodoxin I
MDILVVYGTQYGNTQKVAQAIGRALEPDHRVRVIQAAEARHLRGDGVDLLFVGAPTQMHGLRLLARPFLDALAARGFGGVAAATFDTRMGRELDRPLESNVIAQLLTDAGCRLVAPPESFLVLGFEGPLADGEEARAEAWARSVVESVGPEPADQAGPA